MMDVMVTKNVVGDTSGRVMCLNLFQGLAPSIWAASVLVINAL